MPLDMQQKGVHNNKKLSRMITLYSVHSNHTPQFMLEFIQTQLPSEIRENKCNR